MRRTQFLFLLSLLYSASSAAQAVCPDLTPYYPGEEANWSELASQLSPLQSQCLQNAEYYALYGAAQLNSGAIVEAAESLERALLLEPDNGAAKIDYAQALFLQGQLFSALELNEQLLERQDLPANLQPVLQTRQQNWRALTRERSGRLDLLAGYDNNLNSAPDSDLITLTLSGEPILLELSPEFQATSGPYLNFRLGGRYRVLAPEHQHNWFMDLRGRYSEDTNSDLLQLDGRYAFIRPSRRHSWQLSGGLSHLQFGGSSLFSAANVNALYQPPSSRICRPYAGLAAQNQLFHGQSYLNALESKLSAGVNCPLAANSGSHVINAEASVLNNAAINSNRPGGDRRGWQLNLGWQFRLPRGEIISQINHTRLIDNDGYTPLLAGGARRKLRRSYALLQYRQPLAPDLTLMVNLYHQRQSSNLELFKIDDSTLEIGLSLAL